ncbi:hypothetical protein IKF28_01200 [Candidatus Saccharibacteria bacterium]|nr:hypothetical protein [Candidatus Saccharibacteria bacterium]
MTEKNKSGAGKFFLGALLGAAAGAIAGKFISEKTKSDDEDLEKNECECGEECECGKKCECEEEPKSSEKKTETPKKATKTSEKK